MSGNGRDEKLGVVFFPPDKTGSTWYRILQPAQKLAEHGLAEVCIVDMGHDPAEAVLEVIKASDILVYLYSFNEAMAENFREIRKAGKKVVMDMNDDIFSISPFSPHYGDLGLFEYEFDDAQGEKVYLWKDGLSQYRDLYGNPKVFSIDRNRRNMELTKEVLRSVDLITVTTPYLAELYGEFAPTAVLPDYVDLEVWKPLSVRYPGENYFRLGWRGGWSHYEDLYAGLPALERAFKKYPWVKFVMSGFRPKGFVDLFPKERIELHPFMGHPAYPWHMMALGIDAAFYPWKSIPFNHGKNNLCWVEWSALGVAGVYPGMAPYTEHVVNGETGLLAVTEEGYADCLDRLIWNKKLRRDIARAARAEVETKWDINKNIYRWEHVYRSLFKEGEELCSESPDRKEASGISSPALH